MTGPNVALPFTYCSRHAAGGKRPEVTNGWQPRPIMCGSASVSEVRKKGSKASDNGKQQEVQGFSCGNNSRSAFCMYETARVLQYEASDPQADHQQTPGLIASGLTLMFTSCGSRGGLLKCFSRFCHAFF